MLELIVGNKKYSSWSMRPWIALKHTQAPFTERVIGLDQREALLTAVRLLSLGAARERKGGAQLDEAEIAERLPWSRFLSASDRGIFVGELLSTFEACADLGAFTALGRLVEEWKATASLHAEGIAGRLKGPLREPGAKVHRP